MSLSPKILFDLFNKIGASAKSHTQVHNLRPPATFLPHPLKRFLRGKSIILDSISRYKTLSLSSIFQLRYDFMRRDLICIRPPNKWLLLHTPNIEALFLTYN